MGVRQNQGMRGGAVQNVCHEECVERLKQFRDVSKPFSTEPGLAGTYQHGPWLPCSSSGPGGSSGVPWPLYLSDLTLYLSTRYARSRRMTKKMPRMRKSR